MVEAPRVPFWLKSLQVTHELLLSKTCPVFVGMILVCAITITAAIYVFGYKPGSALSADIYDHHHVKATEAWGAFGIFVILVLSAVGGKLGFLYIRPRISPASSHRVNTPRSRTYMGGLAMMPAWGWKAFIVVFTVHVLGEDYEHWQIALLTFGLAFASSVFQVGLEYLGRQLPEASFAGQCIATTRACFAVGVGYTVNLCIMTIAGPYLWSFWPVRMLYTILVTALMMWVEQRGEKALEGVRATWHPLAIRTVEFIIHSGKFVVAWAWKGFLDLVVRAWLIGYTSSPCHDQILVATTETLIYITFVMICSWTEFAYDLCLLVCGMGIGWCWAEVWLACFYNKGMRENLGTLWIAAGIIVLSACILAVCIDWLFKKAEEEMIELDEGKPLFSRGRMYTRVLA